MLRVGSAAAVLSHRVVAINPGDVLRSFTFGHVRQLDRVAEQALIGAWAAGAGPASAP